MFAAVTVSYHRRHAAAAAGRDPGQGMVARTGPGDGDGAGADRADQTAGRDGSDHEAQCRGEEEQAGLQRGKAAKMLQILRAEEEVRDEDARRRSASGIHRSRSDGATAGSGASGESARARSTTANTPYSTSATTMGRSVSRSDQPSSPALINP